MEVSIDRQQGANAWLTVGIREGRNREIRRALDHVGLSVNRLIRISYGPFQLGTLKRGAVEQVKPKVLREQLGEDAPGPDTQPPSRPTAKAAAQRTTPAQLRPGAQKPCGSPKRRPKLNTGQAGFFQLWGWGFVF